MAPADIVTSLSLLNGKTTWESLSRFKKKCSNLLLLNLSGAKGYVPEKVITFARLRELNVSRTSIDNHFLSQLSRTCKHLYCLNIAGCLNVTHEGILQSSFNLAVISDFHIAHNAFGFPHKILHKLLSSILKCI